jgi:outer membrane protein OmpA-like peptidoglycan-associated protein
VGLTWSCHSEKKMLVETPVIPVKTCVPVDTIIEEVKQKPVLKEVVKDTIPTLKEPIVVLNEKPVLPIIQFKINSFDILNGNNNGELKSLANMLHSNSNLRVRIIGHTCNLGSHDFNLKLGLKRAETVKAILIEYSASASQIKTESKAYDNPIAPNTNKENRAKNRRVEVVIE